MKVYYAHSKHLYNKPQEKRDIDTLKALGFIILNPNSPAVEIGVTEYKKSHGEDRCMEFFNELLDECDAIAFRAHPDGKIPSGVGYEIEYMFKKGKPIIELPSLLNSKFMEVGETRQYLELLGER